MGYRAMLITSDNIKIQNWFRKKYEDLYNINESSIASKNEMKYYDDSYSNIEILQDIQKMLNGFESIDVIFLYEDGSVVIIKITKESINGFFMCEQFNEPMSSVCYYGGGK